jgi:spoIIIJ-associated protein
MEWVEVTGRTVEIAVAAALKELGLSSTEEATIDVVQEPKAGFLGMGRIDAVVKVTRKPQQKKRRGRRRRKPGDAAKTEKRTSQRPEKTSKRPKDKQTTGKPGQRSKQEHTEQKQAGKKSAPAAPKRQRVEDKPVSDINEQAEVAQDFLEGLVDAFGLEGTVSTRVDEDILFLDISGGQTEALVGQKGSIMYAILDLTRTVIQRKTHGAPRMRIDIAGYGERRRTALETYARRLADRVLVEGGEIALEPMNPADRKVIHDAVTDIEGIETYSEGEDPRRAVIIAMQEGVEPTGGDEKPEETDDREEPEASDD